MGVISKEIALQEVEKWLDYKKITPNKREVYKDNIESLANSIADGTLVLNDDLSLTHNLIFEIGSETKTSILKYKPRINVGNVYSHMNGVKATDIDGRLHAYICALTGSPKLLVQQLDTEDISIAQNIAVFFI